ncbi:hypothetical protein fugu_016096, partial [Takifugu bimaculatus]
MSPDSSREEEIVPRVEASTPDVSCVAFGTERAHSVRLATCAERRLNVQRRMGRSRQRRNAPNLLLLIGTICSSPTITCTSEFDPRQTK